MQPWMPLFVCAARHPCADAVLAPMSAQTAPRNVVQRVFVLMVRHASGPRKRREPPLHRIFCPPVGGGRSAAATPIVGFLRKASPAMFLKQRLAFAAVFAVASSLCASTAQTPTFHDLQGAPHTLAELHGHPAVVNFWATWCGPCKEEMPRLQKLAESYAPKDVRFVAISLDAPDTAAKIPAVTHQRNFSIPVWTGANERTLAGPPARRTCARHTHPRRERYRRRQNRRRGPRQGRPVPPRLAAFRQGRQTAQPGAEERLVSAGPSTKVHTPPAHATPRTAIN